jgi:isopentenyl-diphosphate Delta-isomerase
MYPLQQNTVSMPEPIELVSLMAEDGTPIGIADKFELHGTETPLHLAFSCHVFNSAGAVLATRRALSKPTWPGVWTNSFCGHPAPDEAMEAAIARRASLELGITLDALECVLPDFRYRAVDASGVVENEICPVYRATTRDTVSPNSAEVAEFEWVDFGALRQSVAATPFAFSPWLVLQLRAWP